MDETDTPFDAERHEADLGCEEAGRVGRSLHPGYRIGDRVICKATVGTVPAHTVPVPPEGTAAT